MASAAASCTVIILTPRASTSLLAGGSWLDGTQANPYVANSPRAQEEGGGMARTTDRRTVPPGAADATLAINAASVASLSAHTRTVDGRILPPRDTRTEDWLRIGQRVWAVRRQSPAGTTVVRTRPASRRPDSTLMSSSSALASPTSSLVRCRPGFSGPTHEMQISASSSAAADTAARRAGSSARSPVSSAATRGCRPRPFSRSRVSVARSIAWRK